MGEHRRKPGWIVYATLLTLAVVAGELSRGEAPDAVALANWVLSAALLVALWCHALQRRLGSERYWRIVFWLVSVTNALLLVPVLLRGGTVALVTACLTLLIVPAYVAAWIYAFRSPSLWTEPAP
ncbi:MAG TPA: hypothetical protein VNS57_12935 [Steroidobacteraceae bacterium]|nr:hypothetical protein [Steroidobacteraceae bacterium]